MRIARSVWWPGSVESADESSIAVADRPVVFLVFVQRAGRRRDPCPRGKGAEAVTSMTQNTRPRRVAIGVDTHKHVHVAVALDELGTRLGDVAIAVDRPGYERLLGWASGYGKVLAFGIEGTGSYGAALASLARRRGHTVIEVARPDRRERRLQGKSDLLDAENAARAVLAGTATATPKSADGVVEMLRQVKVAKDTAVKARTAAIVTLKALMVTAPPELREQLVEAFGIGPDTAAEVLIVAGDNPERIRTEAAWAKLCGVAPIPASSGMTKRHRLNRGGHRQANAALYRTVIVRMQYQDSTRAYVARRVAEGRTKAEIIRCLKRFVAREIWALYAPSSRALPRPSRGRLTAIGASTRSPRPRSASTRPSSSSVTGRGAPQGRWSWPRSSTSTGSTTGGSTARSETSRRPRQREGTTRTYRSRTW